MSITIEAPAITGERLFPTCAPWCAWHYAEDTEAEPGCCWAEDVLIPGSVEVMATWDERRIHTVHSYPSDAEDAAPVVTEEPRPPLSITVFRADVPGFDGGVSFTSLEQAEACAHALLGMVARLRGDEQLAAVHLTAGTTAAAHATGATR